MRSSGLVTTQSIRVVYNNLPYLLTVRDDGSVERAFGPFTPGTEPSMAECSDENEVRDGELIGALQHLVPLSPTIPASDDTLAGS